jgi:hypothetical protein
MRTEIPISVFRYYSNPDNQALDRLENGLKRVLAKIPDNDSKDLRELFSSSFHRNALISAVDEMPITPDVASISILNSVVKDGTDEDLDRALATELAVRLGVGAIMVETATDRLGRWGYGAVNESAGFTAAIGKMVETDEERPLIDTTGMKAIAQALAELSDKPKPMSAITF